MPNTDNDKKKGWVKDLITPIGILSFPRLDTPDDKGKFADGKFKANLLWKKTETAKTNEIVRLGGLAIVSMWGDRFPIAKCKIIVGDGDKKGDLDGYAGCFVLTAKSKFQPGVVDANNKEVPAKTAWSGDTVRFRVTANAFQGTLKDDEAEGLKALGKLVVEDRSPDGKIVFWRPCVTWMLDTVQIIRSGGGGGGRKNTKAFDAPIPESELAQPMAPEETGKTQDDPLFG